MLWNALVLALREMRHNVLRSFLTTLGVVIGVASVIVMVTIGNGVTAKITADIAKLGNNLLMVRPGQRGPGGSDGVKLFTIADAKAIERDIPSLNAVAPTTSRATIAILGNLNWATSVIGTTNEFFTARAWSFNQGRPFTDSELRAGKTVCVLGATVQRELFGEQNPLGNRIRLHKLSCEIIGLLEAKGQSAMGSDQDDLVVMPLRAAQRRVTGNQDIN
jgi:putative ABC transport system permease protein